MGAASSTPPAKGSKTALLVLGSLLAVVILGAVVYFATRTSKEDEALQAVCSARADIKTRVNDLASTTVTTFTLEGFKENVGGITNDVSIIRAAQAELKRSPRRSKDSAAGSRPRTPKTSSGRLDRSSSARTKRRSNQWTAMASTSTTRCARQ
jgi:hypothetical protein